MRSIIAFSIAATVAVGAGCRSTAPASVPQAVPAAPSSGGAQIVQPGRPGEASRVIPAEESARSAALPHTAADTRFMQGMIGHHAQALSMAALVPSRTSNPDLRLLAEKIDVSQRDEIATMRRWLRAREERRLDARPSRFTTGSRKPSQVYGTGSLPGEIAPIWRCDKVTPLVHRAGCLSSFFLEKLCRGRDRQKESARLAQQRNEPKVAVKLHGRFVLRVDKQRVCGGR